MRTSLAVLMVVLMTAGVAHAQLASSTFDTDGEGWTLVGDPDSSTPTWSPTGGNPGGFITGADAQWGITWYFSAPAEFLGDQSAAYGGVLRFDVRQSGGSQWYDDDVVLSGGGYTLVHHFTGNPGTSWTSYTVTLSPHNWEHDGSGAPVSSDELLATLSALTALRIRGEYVGGHDTGDLDNVVLQGPTVLVFPSVGSAPGTPPSVWYTTIWLFNPQEVAATVELAFLRREQANAPPELTHSIRLDADEVVQIDDAVLTLFGVQEFGAIRLQADVPVHGFARVYSRASGQQERDSTGQAFAAVPAGRAIGVGETADLLALTNLTGGDFRYNVGLVETSGNDGWVEVALFTASGSSWITTTVYLRPFEQRQRSVDQLFNNLIGESDNFRLRVTPVSGNLRVIAFGSRVANGSQDATTFEMTYPPLP